jgi:hypothetical protein
MIIGLLDSILLLDESLHSVLILNLKILGDLFEHSDQLNFGLLLLSGILSGTGLSLRGIHGLDKLDHWIVLSVEE